MIRFHTLGVLDLRGPEGLELRSVLQQPKRLGLLAYLTIASPHCFHRRDSLLALFWPDLDQEHARAALRRSLYFLRAELGADVVTGRGDDEVEVPEAALWCDAWNTWPASRWMRCSARSAPWPRRWRRP